MLALLIVLYVYFTPMFKREDTTYTIVYYIAYASIVVVNSVFSFIIFIGLDSFNASIADRAIGGTYMTFLSRKYIFLIKKIYKIL